MKKTRKIKSLLILLLGVVVASSSVIAASCNDVADNVPQTETQAAAFEDGEIIVKSGEQASENFSLATTSFLATDGETVAASDTSVTITATSSDENFSEMRLVWELSFAPELSDEMLYWVRLMEAEGLTIDDYVTVTPSEDTHSAVITCLRPFGAQMQVKAYLQENPDVYATCTLDYQIRMTDITTWMQDSLGYFYDVIKTDMGNMSTVQLRYNDGYGTFGWQWNSTAGTMATGDTTATISLMPEFSTFIKSKLSDYTSAGAAQSLNLITLPVASYAYSGLLFYFAQARASVAGFEQLMSTPIREKYQAAVNEFAVANPGVPFAYIQVSYGGNNAPSTTARIYLTFPADGEFAVNTVESESET